MKLSVLDQAPVTAGNQSAEAIIKAVELALLADELGYHRMWLAEHHNTTTFASSAPEIIIAYLSSLTKNLRLGTGGTMMMHYSPLKMAEVFKTLSALNPGKIDFGVGRAPGGDMKAIYALSEGARPELRYLYKKLETTLELIKDALPSDSLYQETIASPSQIVLPEAWLLGSSGDSAREAARMGVGYSFAQFFMGSLSKEILDLYKSRFQPSDFMEKPEINVAYLATVAESLEEAEYEAAPADIQRLMMAKGQKPVILTPEAAKSLPLTELDRMKIQENRKIHLVGTPAIVADKLLQEGNEYGFDEAMIVSITHSQEKRLNTYRLLAKEII
ncbi:MsnO8 family LLM class oxidoreductase [Carnobacterium divergens]|uniref:LLM class flavin-dependent oxidoreductase n=1 Tax=Carnobacterium divergens TaxID=2748 RepID=A0A2R8A434_CARDV|nr:MsnO8 family LLM class oxidoreductase [Carnobacterium divergens]MCO6019231.1 MsnO8 family LLM class oxidoreductase [Carnobacterium divergens]MPQ23078.1 MsnO8 family LLM class oxidoreductase [Carnobacterium divergens]TFI63483.1 LLM class flavin-dependent oxidoreductase [Carnobacterium divergens]TFI73852.1 LLM class flavin-dependent oxidoreductase [Carnobacterium divergens]TFI77822.1 LLM class flavin-dependent oxidoreductase [Carnobacterium divergens]